MNTVKIQEICQEVLAFQMPRYEELPRINLYLDQVIDEVVYILSPLFGNNESKWITHTMVGNYIKQGILPRPLGKKYSKEHIAYLLYISIAKQVLTMGEIRRLLEIQRRAYPIETAYDYLCIEFENALRNIFHRDSLCPPSYETEDLEANVFRSTVISVAFAIYTRKMLEVYDTPVPTE